MKWLFYLLFETDEICKTWLCNQSGISPGYSLFRMAESSLRNHYSAAVKAWAPKAGADEATAFSRSFSELGCCVLLSS